MTDLRFQRTELLIKKERIEKLNNSKVLVFGLGGVGSYVVEALARGGVGTLGICDMDVVNITNINRQLIALTSTLDKPKVKVTVIITYESICFIFLSFFLNIGTSCVSAGAYFFIIKILKIHIPKTVIYFIKLLPHTKYLLITALPI